ncbi:thioesterase domain-containing protein [Streptomyces sp. NPDC056544]|uniref:thioesterase domain-containing protein n=1 Tax=Streptomyces sp. NPDC056544 TaxID=3345863 RepID=UPI003689BB70
MEIQPEGPHRPLGRSFGGVMGHAPAVELRARGHEVELLAVVDAYPGSGEAEPEEGQLHRVAVRVRPRGPERRPRRADRDAPIATR